MYTPEMILEAGANAGLQRHQLNFLIQQLKIRYGSNGSQNSGKPLVMRSLPPASEIEQALNLAQAEIRAMYKRLEIKGSNVLDKIDATLETVQAAMPS